MIRINLLPYRAARKKETIINQLLIFGVVAAIVASAGVWYHLKLVGNIDTLNTSIEDTRKDIQKYKKIAQQVNELKNKLAELKRKLERIEKLDARRDEALDIMETLTELVVENRMWIDRLQTQERVQSKTVPHPTNKKSKLRIQVPFIRMRIQGIALDDKTIAEFLQRMQNKKFDNGKPYFKNIDLRSVTKKSYASKTGLRRFDLFCLMYPEDKLGEEKTNDKNTKKEIAKK